MVWIIIVAVIAFIKRFVKKDEKIFKYARAFVNFFNRKSKEKMNIFFKNIAEIPDSVISA